MTELDKVTQQKDKLRNLCDEHGYVYELKVKAYPIRLTIKPLCTMDAQMSMIEKAEEDGFTSPDASITFEMKDGDIGCKFSEKFAIAATLLTKLLNIFKKIATFYVFGAHRTAAEYNMIGSMPDVLEKSDDNRKSAEDMAEEAENEVSEEEDAPDDDDFEGFEDGDL